MKYFTCDVCDTVSEFSICITNANGQSLSLGPSCFFNGIHFCSYCMSYQYDSESSILCAECNDGKGNIVKQMSFTRCKYDCKRIFKGIDFSNSVVTYWYCVHNKRMPITLCKSCFEFGWLRGWKTLFGRCKRCNKLFSHQFSTSGKRLLIEKGCRK